jgi:hypothetical protein
MKKATVCGLLAAAFCAGNVEAITYNFNEGIEKYGTSAESFYPEISLPGWKFDDNTIFRPERIDASNQLSYSVNGGDGFGIIMNTPGLIGGESGEIIFNTPVFGVAISAIINDRVDWIDRSGWGTSSWSITAYDADGNQLAYSQQNFYDTYWHNLGELSAESSIAIARVVVATPENLGINTLVTVPDGGHSALLAVIGFGALIGFSRLRAA